MNFIEHIKKLTVLTLFIILNESSVKSDIPDVTTVVRFGESPGEAVDLEIHARTHSRGKILNRNGDILSPYSPNALPPLSCVGSAKECDWQVEQSLSWKEQIIGQVEQWSWKEQQFSEKEYEALSIDFQEGDDDCEWESVSNSSGSFCICPAGFQLSDDQVTCIANLPCSYILTSNYGKFTSTNYPNAYNNNARCSWLIKPQKRSIKISFGYIQTEEDCDFIEVYEWPNLELKYKYSGQRNGEDIVISSGVLVRFSSDESRGYSGFSASFEAIDSFPVLELESDIGQLSTEIAFSEKMMCVTAIHMLPPDGALDMRVSSSDSATVLEHSRTQVLAHRKLEEISSKRFYGDDGRYPYDADNAGDVEDANRLYDAEDAKVGNWCISRFTTSAPIETMESRGQLNVELRGKGSKILSILGCDASDTGDAFYIPDTNYHWNNSQVERYKTISGGDNKCTNGIFSKIHDACVCHAGFTGSTCAEACGPNRFGDDCTGLCSLLDEGCKGLMFCKNELPCQCGPGFTGNYCNRSCDAGYYGANCSQKCGECYENLCDVYTGQCQNGCTGGFYPPDCRETYLRISEAPTVVKKVWNSVQLSIDLTELEGYGEPYFYQVQLLLPSGEWVEMTPEEVQRNSTTTNVTGLTAGTEYSAKVIIINKDGQSYQGPLIPVLSFVTTCSVPGPRSYDLRSTKITPSTVVVTWKVDSIVGEEWCPIRAYEVVLRSGGRRLNRTVGGGETTAAFTNLLPGHMYHLHVQGKTIEGNLPPSSELLIRTTHEGPGRAMNLQASPSSATELRVSWQTLESTSGYVKKYKVHYQCLKLLACGSPCENTKGELEANISPLDIGSLLPHAQYQIRVSAISDKEGPFSTTRGITAQTVPNVHPEASPHPIVTKSNSSATVQWEPPQCSGLNGYLKGYVFELMAFTKKGSEFVQSGRTKNNQTSFTGLKPSTSYEVNVYAVNTFGTNAFQKLTIPFTTSATVPDAVQNLVVYKKGRRTIGLRWAPPEESYAALKSFAVVYRQENKRKEERVVVGLVPCPAWPNFFCHTITSLVPDKKYIISVRALNSEVDDDGSPSEVVATTREEAPGVPTRLNVTSDTRNSCLIEWELPTMLNGVLRSFVVNVEHVDSLNSSDCCEYFPVQELPVRDESSRYSVEVSGLSVASTYTISVSAKTVTIGAAVNTTYNTAPPPPAKLHPPHVIADGGSFIAKVKPSEIPAGLTGTYLILLLPNEESAESEIFSSDVTEQLRENLKQPFYVVAEINADDLREEQIVRFGTGVTQRGRVAVLQDPVLLPGLYRIGLALVLDYNGAKSVGLEISNQFVVEDSAVVSTEE